MISPVGPSFPWKAHWLLPCRVYPRLRSPLMSQQGGFLSVLWQSWAWWSLVIGVSPAVLSEKAHLSTCHLLEKGSSASAYLIPRGLVFGADLGRAWRSTSAWGCGFWIDLREIHPFLEVLGRYLFFRDLVLEEPLWVTFLNTSLSWKMGPG